MANATQSTTPADFMPILQEFLALSLGADDTDVRVTTEESFDAKPHPIGDRVVGLELYDPDPVNPNAGAGRRGFPTTRVMAVHLLTRGGLDEAGQDIRALADHWGFQDQVIDALLVLPHTVAQTPTELKPFPMPFIGPIKHVKGSGGKVHRVGDSTATYRSTLYFVLSYVPNVKVP